MKNYFPGLLTKAHQWTDVVLLNLAFIIAYWFRFGNTDVFLDGQYVNLLLVANLVWVFTIYVLKTYVFTVYPITFMFSWVII
jgi:hypothetical protein